MESIRKYPRTPHMEGSRLQPGDEDLDSVPFGDLAGRYLVVEEKVDGANSGLSFDESGSIRLQSRGHYLTGGPRERQFDFFKAWAARHAETLFAALGSRYVLYGEWLYAKHTVFYDALPHYFLEFDVLDTATDAFLSTSRRRSLLAGLPVASAPVLWEGPAPSLDRLRSLLGPSRFKSANWRGRLAAICAGQGLDLETVLRETDRQDAMEGIYIKVEDGDQVLERFKFVRPSFSTAVVESGSHWLDRPILPNQLRPGVDLYGDALPDG